MNTMQICLLALAYLNAHVPPLDRVSSCSDTVITSGAGDTFTVSSMTPRPFWVVIDARGHVLRWFMSRVGQ
jgi:hypothetical protein